MRRPYTVRPGGPGSRRLTEGRAPALTCCVASPQRCPESVMSLNRRLCSVAAAALALLTVPLTASAQPGAFGGGYGPALVVVPPPRAFATSDEHYKYLLDRAGGGKKQTLA